MCCYVLSFECLFFVPVLRFFFLLECVNVIFVLLNKNRIKKIKKITKFSFLEEVEDIIYKNIKE